MNTIQPTLARTQSLVRLAGAPPSSTPVPQSDSFIKSYVDNVRANFNEDGVGSTLLSAGLYGFGGGILGGIGGALFGSVLPGPVGPFVASTMEVAGAVGGFLHRLGSRSDD